MGGRGAEGSAEESEMSDIAAGRTKEAKPVKVAWICVVAVGSRTAMNLTFSVRQDSEKGVCGRDRTAGREVLGKVLEVERAEAALEERTG